MLGSCNPTEYCRELVISIMTVMKYPQRNLRGKFQAVVLHSWSVGQLSHCTHGQQEGGRGEQALAGTQLSSSSSPFYYVWGFYP